LECKKDSDRTGGDPCVTRGGGRGDLQNDGTKGDQGGFGEQMGKRNKTW